LQRKVVDYKAKLRRQFHEWEGLLMDFALGRFGGHGVWVVSVLVPLHADCERAYRLV
jgi:hypothetical protein